MRAVNHWRTVAFALTLLWAPLACALDPSRQITQYGHNAWRLQDGSIGPANAVAQTRDGYLWIATNMGLIRFDGVRFVPWTAPPGQALPDSRINNLFIARDTSLWIGTQNGIARLKDGVLTNFDVRGQIDAMAEGDDGTIWIARAHLGPGDRDSPICSYDGEQFHCYKGTGMPFQWATAIARAEDGYLWIGSSSGICRWKPDHLAVCDLPETLASAGGSLGVADVMPTANGLLVGIARTGPGLGLEEFSISTSMHCCAIATAASGSERPARDCIACIKAAPTASTAPTDCRATRLRVCTRTPKERSGRRRRKDWTASANCTSPVSPSAKA